MVHGLCYTGLAHRLMLDNPAAESCFRKALRIAKRSGGSHSYTARLASSALGELLYERGELDEADRLLDEGYKLGPEGGSVDFKIARYVIAARIKALQGDRHAAGQRLDEAIRIARGAVTEAAAGDGGARTHPPRAAAASGFRCVAGGVVREAPPAGGRDRRDHRAVRGGLGHPAADGRR